MLWIKEPVSSRASRLLVLLLSSSLSSLQPERYFQNVSFSFSSSGWSPCSGFPLRIKPKLCTVASQVLATLPSAHISSLNPHYALFKWCSGDTSILPPLSHALSHLCPFCSLCLGQPYVSVSWTPSPIPGAHCLHATMPPFLSIIMVFFILYINCLLVISCFHGRRCSEEAEPAYVWFISAPLALGILLDQRRYHPNICRRRKWKSLTQFEACCKLCWRREPVQTEEYLLKLHDKLSSPKLLRAYSSLWGTKR